MWTVSWSLYNNWTKKVLNQHAFQHIAVMSGKQVTNSHLTEIAALCPGSSPTISLYKWRPEGGGGVACTNYIESSSRACIKDSPSDSWPKALPWFSKDILESWPSFFTFCLLIFRITYLPIPLWCETCESRYFCHFLHCDNKVLRIRPVT